jgi:DNA invertase Pin-like site-specific DNA recombinase
MKKYVGYFRVSTKRQGESGLGLEAQKQLVAKFGECIESFVESESGRKNNRPELLKAIDYCKRHNATLLVAKLDRLSRDEIFIFTLRDSGVDFICADNPHANSLTIGLLAVIACDEVKKIRERTKSALQVKKEQLALEGKRLGCPDVTSTGRTVKDIMRENRKHRVYAKPDPSKVEALKIMHQSVKDIGKLKEFSAHIFGSPISKTTIYSYLKM